MAGINKVQRRSKWWWYGGIDGALRSFSANTYGEGIGQSWGNTKWRHYCPRHSPNYFYSPKNVCIKSNQNKIYWILWGESILQIIFCYSGLRRQQQLGDEKVLCWGKSLTAICSPRAGRSQCLPRGFNLTHKWGEHDLPLIAKLQLFQISRLIWTLSTTTIQINLGNVGQLAFSHWI